MENEILDYGDIVIDIGGDGAPLGYEIQHASIERDFIPALILGESRPAAAAEWTSPGHPPSAPAVKSTVLEEKEKPGGTAPLSAL